MKFVVVLIGAGALAFLGAVICIVASVYPRKDGGGGGGGAAAFADNGTLASGTPPQPLASGALARAGPLGALHGSESYGGGGGGGGGGGLGLGLETPALNELSTGEAAPKQFSFSRLVCTPVPVGECDVPGRRRQQADEAYGGGGGGGEDRGYLRTSADQLRRTVVRQNDQILMDRRTIRELSGKLAECESGLEVGGGEAAAAAGGGGGAAPERSVGVWAGNRRLMAGDDDGGGAPEQLLTARAVEELERAILDLKDRIDKLELEIGPPALNLTGAAPPAPVAASAPRGPPRRLDDLEGQLERRIQQLQRERTAVRTETQAQQRGVDRGLHGLQHRLTHLESALTEAPLFPEGFVLSLPMRTDYMYGLVRRDMPEMYAFTACVWLRAREAGVGTPFSYAVPGQPNELVLLQGVNSPLELLINDKVAQLPLALRRGEWEHVCVSWTLRDGVWKAYQGGRLRGRGEGLAAWHPIKPGGVLILGQEQDTLGGRFDASQALVGELSQFNLWDRVLRPAEVAALADCSSASLGNVSPWGDGALEVYGGAAKEPVEPCRDPRRSPSSGPKQ